MTAIQAEISAQMLVCGILQREVHAANSDALCGLSQFPEIEVGNVATERIRTSFGMPTVDLAAVQTEFSRSRPGECLTSHLYEMFLAEYDGSHRKARGVYYTPKPVASFIVRSVHRLLQTEFGLPDGLADTGTWGDLLREYSVLKLPQGVQTGDPFVRILDPAAGTGIFLIEAIDLIHKTMTSRWKAAGCGESEIRRRWVEYVPAHLLPRLWGFELMPAACAAMKMQIAVKLRQTGCAVRPPDCSTGLTAGCVRVYQTNSLEGEKAESSPHPLPAFTVILGNPPYSALSANLSPAARKLIDPYRFVDGQPIRERGALQFEKNLNDDYVKFIRLAESLVEESTGVVGLITSNAYFEAATLRGMRSHLMGTFDRLRLIDLHGDADRRETADDGSADENVFPGVKRGVAIALFSRLPNAAPPGFQARLVSRQGQVSRADIRGTRLAKLARLTEADFFNVDWRPCHPHAGAYLFTADQPGLTAAYDSGWSVADLFQVYSTGFESGRDEILTHFTKEELGANLRRFATAPKSQVRRTYDVDAGWGRMLLEARELIASDPNFALRLRPFLFAPFDVRFCYYRKPLLKTNSFSAGKHLCYGRNIALMVMRQVSLDADFTHVGVTRIIPNNRCFYSTRGKISYFPLRLYRGEDDVVRDTGECAGINLRSDLPMELAKALKLRWIEYGRGTQCESGTFNPEDVMHFIYAQLHAPSYRQRFAARLRSDFPRVFSTHDAALFRTLCQLGADLVACHLLEGDYPAASWNCNAWPSPFDSPVAFVEGTGIVEIARGFPRYDAGKLFLNADRWFCGVSPVVWQSRVGGYQVCKKWLRDRRGRALDNADLSRFSTVLSALWETDRLMREVDATIEKHGGWERAFGSRSE